MEMINSGELVPFENQEFGKLRVKLINDEPWFVAKDVCDILGLEQVTRAISSLDTDEKITLTNSNPNPRAGIPRQLNLISESGLYDLVFKSRKPFAKKFSKWVRSEVLPSIRKTGQYSVNNQSTQNTKMLDCAIRIYELAGLKGNQLALAADKFFKNETGQSALESAGVQLISEKQSHLYTPTELGKMIDPELSAKQVNRKLMLKGYQIKNGDKWEPTEDGLEMGATFIDVGKQHSDGTPVTQLKWRYSQQLIDELS